MAEQDTRSRTRRRDHSAEFKREVVQQCLQPGASVSAEDCKLADHVARFVKDMPAVRERLAQRQREHQLQRQPHQRQTPNDQNVGEVDPNISR